MNKSYKQFSLITLQLIIPLSTMTKAEYKETYGIDLDDIDIEKVTLLQEDGSKNKYFVDLVKTTESGIDIYAGGKILSIGSSVSVLDNVYSVENAKPIYIHPISIVLRGVGKPNYNLSFIIFNNSETPFTMDTFKQYINTLYSKVGATIRLICSGYWQNDDKSKYGSPSVLAQISGNTYTLLLGNGDEGSTFVSSVAWEDIFDTPQEFTDGVNKIN